MVRIKIMIAFLNLFFGLALLLNVKLLPNLNSLQDYILFTANFIMLIHIWWGAGFLLTKVGHPRKLFDWVLAIIVFISLILPSRYIKNAVMWFGLYTIAFSFIILIYLRCRGYCKTSQQESYITSKISIEKWSILFFFAGFLSLFLFRAELLYLLIVLMALFFQIPFIVYLLIKKVYKMC